MVREQVVSSLIVVAAGVGIDRAGDIVKNIHGGRDVDACVLHTADVTVEQRTAQFHRHFVEA